MSSLFLRIFLWYWVVMAVLGLVLLALTATTNTENSSGRRQARMDEALRFQARAASTIYLAEGKDQAERYIRSLRRFARMRAWLFDENGQLLAGGSAPATAGRLAKQATASPSGTTRLTGENDSNRLGAQAIQTSDGRRFTLVGEWSRRGTVEVTRFRLLGGRTGPQEGALRLFVVLLTAGVLCYVLARYLTVPVVRLRAATQQLASGDLDTRVGSKIGNRNDELSALARDFDVMAARLQDLVVSQRRLLGDMSHELRSPLARLNVALDLARLHDSKGARDALMKDLDRAERESARLNELIGQLLSLAHLESGEAKVQAETVDLNRLVQEIVADADFEAKHQNRSVALSEDGTCRMQGDAELLRRAIENVVRNGVLYTAENTVVDVMLNCADATAGAPAITVQVRDHGPGVPEAELTKLFRPFHRVETARDRASGGVGLGLAIAERAVRLHSGTIEARNAPDGGLMVEIIFPAGEPQSH